MKKGLLYGALALAMALMPLGEEPHLVGKIRWVAGGASGMQLMDWFDLLIHGGPILAVLIFLILKLVNKKN